MRPDRRGEARADAWALAWAPSRTSSRARAWASAAGVALCLAPRGARAGDAGFDFPTLTTTETAIATQRFAPRGNEALEDSEWGAWINRLDAALQAGRWTAGLRLDSAVFWSRPDSDPTRFQDAVYPAKLWVTYAAPGLEVTLGDAYAQFGRGLTLSMRKVDELGIDTTVRGIKVEFQRDPFAVTAIAGFANPARVDEASGRSLFPAAQTPSLPVFGSDRVVGAEIQAGRGLPVTLATRVVRFSRCAPYSYDANAAPITDFGKDPGGVAFGSCNAQDVTTWLNELPSAPPGINANDITMAGQSIEVPNLAGHGKLYLEAATQYRHSQLAGPNANDAGNALYAAFAFDAGPVTSTLEIKSNRNFYPVAAAIDLTHAPEFNAVTYSFVPPAESPTILDTEFGYFNACVNGGRLRTDVRASDSLLVYGQGIFADTKSENTDGGCDARGRVVSSLPAAEIEDVVWDGVTGLEWTFNHDLSHVFASGGVRENHQGTGETFYRERHLEYSIAKYLRGPFSIEVQGFHRLRWEQGQNLYASDPSSGLSLHWWHEGENYLALKVAPAWVFSQGIEYTTQRGYPALYANGSILYKFGRGSNLRLFVGQQRAAFRCASGICRFFPAFEGARAELTLRF
jgi:hypothetical protein